MDGSAKARGESNRHRSIRTVIGVEEQRESVSAPAPTTVHPVVRVFHDAATTSTAAQELVGKGLEIRARSLAYGNRVVLDKPDVDLIVVDVAQPSQANEFCREVRRRSSVPLIVITAGASEAEVILGLELGADDYVVAPYAADVLAAKIRAFLRRASQSPRKPDGVLIVGAIVLDSIGHEVRVRGERVAVPLKEFSLLELLMRNQGRAMSREEILSGVWGPEYKDSSGNLNQHIGRLRRRIEVDPANPQLLVNVKGLGFKLNDRYD